MQLEGFVEGLQADLEQIAAVGDDATAEAARRLIAAVRASAGLRLLDVLSEAALELTAQLPSGHVEVRVAGQDPSLVYVEEEAEATPPAAGEDAQAARITLRLPEALKAAVDAAAAREGVSVNTWLVRALGRAVGSGGARRGPGNRLTGFGRS
jgi:predicted DNA binding CopG/RHH family protein